jgi:uncharacterized protein with HEPN domain
MNGRDMRIIRKIITYCDRIENNIKRYDNSFRDFCEDMLFQDACCMCVLQIGELAGSLSDETKERYATIPWRIIKDTRNVYVHAYGTIAPDVVWKSLQDDIPTLKAACVRILEESRNSETDEGTG